MRRLSAADASRRFSEVLDEVERGGESYLIVRHGRVVATIGPVSDGTGKALKEAVRTNRPDDAWVDELRKLRNSMVAVTDR